MSETPVSAEPQRSLPPVGPKTAALALLTAALWGANPVAVSYSVDALPPIFVACLRFALATVFMYFWCRVQGSELRLRTRQFLPCLLAGIGLFAQIATFNVGVSLSSSSHASMLINTFVFWVVVIEHFVTKTDRVTVRRIFGLILAAAGVVLILWTEGNSKGDVLQQDSPTLLGDAVLLLSALILGIKIVYVKQALRTVEPGKLIFWHDAIGVLLFLGWSMATEEIVLSKVTTPAALAVIYQGVFVGGVCFAVQALLLREHSASQIAVFSFATPLFGVLLGVVMRGDHLTPWLFVAAACVAVGILLVNIVRKRN